MNCSQAAPTASARSFSTPPADPPAQGRLVRSPAAGPAPLARARGIPPRRPAGPRVAGSGGTGSAAETERLRPPRRGQDLARVRRSGVDVARTPAAFPLTSVRWAHFKTVQQTLPAPSGRNTPHHERERSAGRLVAAGRDGRSRAGGRAHSPRTTGVVAVVRLACAGGAAAVMRRRWHDSAAPLKEAGRRPSRADAAHCRSQGPTVRAVHATWEGPPLHVVTLREEHVSGVENPLAGRLSPCRSPSAVGAGGGTRLSRLIRVVARC